MGTIFRDAAFTAVAAAASIGSSGAFAQAAPAPAAPASAVSSQTLAPVVVRGSRDSQDFRAEEASLGTLGDLPLLSVPFSVNVVGRQLLENQQAASYGDYFKNDASATFGNVPVGFATLRGFDIGVDGFLFDGLPGNLGLSDGRSQLESIDRIEILKGPSTFLYGLGSSTSVGGSLNFVPKRPGDVPVRQVSVGYTTRSLYSALADLGDRFGAERQFGYRLNLGLRSGEQAAEGADWRHRAASLALDWRAAPGLAVTASFDYSYNRFPRLQPFFAAFTADVPKPPDSRRSIAQPWDDFAVRSTASYLRADWSINSDWTLTAQALEATSARPKTKEARFGFITDADGSTTLLASEDISKDQETTAQASLRGKVTVAGIENRLTFSALGQRGRFRFGSNDLGTAETNIYAPVDSAEPASTFPEAKVSRKTYSTSLLATDIAKLSEQWSVLGGVRLARLRDQGFDTATGEETGVFRTSKSSPVGALMWKPGPSSLIYLNYAEGLEQGGAASNAPGNLSRLPPIVSRQVEVGAKLETAGLTLTTAAFDIRRPSERPDPADPTGQAIIQSGQQRHRGIEASVTGQATRDLAIVVGAMALSPRVTGTGDAASEGKRPVGVARYVASAYADWRIAALPGVFVNAGVYYNASQYLDSANTQRVPSWTRLDLGARYETRLYDKPAALLVGIENATDRRYWAGAQSGILTVAEPLTVKVTGRFSF